MAFEIFQYCKNRYVTPKTVLMQHNVLIKIEGSFENIEDYMENVFYEIKKISTMSDKFISNRIGITLKEYMTKIKKEWKLVGKEIINNNLADEIVIIGDSDFLYLLQ